MKIFPSVLETFINVFWNQLENLSLFFSYFQIDIADEKLVPNKTIEIEEIINTIVDIKIADAVKERTGETTVVKNHSFEFHLMVKDYLTEIKKLTKLANFMQIKKVLIHLKALERSTFNVKRLTFNPGLVLNPEDDVKSNWSIIKNFPTVQIMSINPGFQGQPFLPKTLNKISELRELGFQGTISLDGAINDKTLPIILKNKYLPDILFPGSYIKEKIEERLRIINELIRCRR